MSQDGFELVDPDPITLSFDAVRVKQPIGDIFVATIDAKSIQRVTYFDVRRRIDEERDVERYLGIQRPLNLGRVQELHRFVNFRDATFPTSVIIAVSDDYARYDETERKLVLSNTRFGEDQPSIHLGRICRVIDGQHRIKGLEKLKEGVEFDLIVSVFVGSDISDQAYIFATVNLEQTKVNRSLAIDLFDLSRSRSPYKTCHNIAVALDSFDESPFFRRIKRLGVATEGRQYGETITQATFVDGLLPYISIEPRIDRDLILRGKSLPRVEGRELEKMVFRNMFIEEKDVEIGKIYEQYFVAVSQRWPEAWSNLGRGSILPRTNGYRALASLFGKIYLSITAPGNFVPAHRFLTEFEKVDVDANYFNTDNFKPGTSGESALRELLRQKIFD
jgi:DGQHR domain-containing protein